MPDELNSNGNGLEEEEDTLGSQVDALLERGYSQKEIRNQGYSPSLVRQRVRRRTKRLGKNPPASSNGNKEIALTIKDKETVLPEWLEGQVSEIFDGSISQQKAFTAGMAIPLLGMRLFSESVKPLLELMKVYTAGQAEAAKAAQGGSQEVVLETISTIMPQILGTVKDSAIAASPNPMAAMMVRLLEPIMGGMFRGMLPQGQQQGQVSNLPEGWEDKRGQQ